MDKQSNDVVRPSSASLMGRAIKPGEEKVLSDTIHVVEREVVDWTNLARLDFGRAPLTINAKLNSAARHHAANMARFGIMDHVIAQADLPTVLSRIKHYGYPYRGYSENVAFNAPDADFVVIAWMNSPGHRANILNLKFKEIGVGVRMNDAGEPYYCQVFGVRR